MRGSSFSPPASSSRSSMRSPGRDAESDRGGSRIRHTSLRPPTVEPDGLRVECPTERALEQPAARSVSTGLSAASATLSGA